MTRALAAAAVLLACGPAGPDATATDTTSGAASTGATTSAASTDATTSAASTSAASTGPAPDTTSTADPTTTAATTTLDDDDDDSAGTTTPTDLPRGGCRDDAECGADEECMQPSGPGCAQCNHAYPTCVEDSVCEQPGHCVEPPVDCPCDDPFTTACVPFCDGDDDCGADEHCDLATGYCNDPCPVDGCPPLFDCVEAWAGETCRRRQCTDDRACDGALCVDGFCHTEPGTCVTPAN